MLLGDFDWNQVLMRGLIGAVVGGFMGLGVYVFQKLTGAGKKPTRDRPPQGKTD